MMNESVKNNVSTGNLFGVNTANMAMPAGWEAQRAEVKAKAARMMTACNPEGGSPEAFMAKLKMAMENGSERMAKLAEIAKNGSANANTAKNNNTNEVSNANGAEEDFVNFINNTLDLLSDQELIGFFVELNAVSHLLVGDEGSDRLALKLEALNLDPENKNTFADALISSAFKRISEMLGLTSDEDLLGKPFTVEFDAENIEHLAAIMWYLEQTITLVNERLDAGKFAADAAAQPQVTQSADIVDMDDPADLANLSSSLRKEKFNLEMAFRIVGIQEMISAMVAERSDKSVPAGIPQASDPANLGMSTSDVVKAFASLIKEELTSAMDRVRAITSGQAEMTDIEKAAVKLGAIKSEILSGALEGNNALNRAAFEKAAAELRAVMMNNAGEKVNAEANTAIKAAASDAALPISASESANKKAADSVEAANKKASESVAVAVKSASGKEAGLPISAKESANNKEHADTPVQQKSMLRTIELTKIVDDMTDLRIGAVKSVKINGAEASAQNLAAFNAAGQSISARHNVNAGQNANAGQNVNAGQSVNTAQNVTAAQNITAEQSVIVGQNVNIEQAASDKYAHTAHTGEHAHANNANTNNAPASNAAASSSNMVLNSMVTAEAATSEASAEASASADSSDSDSQTGLEGINSRASAALESAEKARTAMARVDQEAVIRQLTEKMQHAVRNGAHELRMVLRPETLGEVRMSIRVHGDIVMARMQVENRQVKAIVESNLQTLKDALEKQNLHVGAFSVDVGTENDRSPRQTWREMAEEAGISKRVFKDGIGAEENEIENDPLSGELGSDTGRRFGNNTFEYFI